CTCVDATLSPFAVAVHRRPPPSPLFPYTTLFRSLEHWKTEGHGPDARCPDLDRFRAVADEHRDAGAWRLTLCGMTRADVMGLRRSEEHTSELQSRFDLVCRLLLENTKKAARPPAR